MEPICNHKIEALNFEVLFSKSKDDLDHSFHNFKEYLLKNHKQGSNVTIHDIKIQSENEFFMMSIIYSVDGYDE